MEKETKIVCKFIDSITDETERRKIVRIVTAFIFGTDKEKHELYTAAKKGVTSDSILQMVERIETGKNHIVASEWQQ